MNSSRTVKVNYKINEEESAKCLIKLRSTRTSINLVIEYIMQIHIFNVLREQVKTEKDDIFLKDSHNFKKHF